MGCLCEYTNEEYKGEWYSLFFWRQGRLALSSSRFIRLCFTSCAVVLVNYHSQICLSPKLNVSNCTWTIFKKIVRYFDWFYANVCSFEWLFSTVIPNIQFRLEKIPSTHSSHAFAYFRLLQSDIVYRMSSHWIDYKCKAGQTLFMCNKLTGENKSTAEINNVSEKIQTYLKIQIQYTLYS